MNDVQLRLLPWDQDGKPAYLRSDDPRGYIARLADQMESVHLGTARELAAHARALLGGHASPRELCRVVERLCEALNDVARVAESRGERLDQS